MPSDSTIVAPCSGRLIVAPDSGHAYGIATPDGVEVLIHVGIDTVNLQGKGFTTHVKLNQEVKAGDPLVDVDLDAVQGAGYSLATPMLITNHRNFGDVVPIRQKAVQAGDPLLTVHLALRPQPRSERP